MSERSIALAAVIAAVVHPLAMRPGFAAGRKPIQPGQQIRISIGPAPIKLGERTLASVEAGTILTAEAVKRGLVLVSLERDGTKIRGWIRVIHVVPIPVKPPPKAPEASGTVARAPAKGGKTAGPPKKPATPTPRPDPVTPSGPAPGPSFKRGDRVRVAKGPVLLMMDFFPVARAHTGTEFTVLGSRGKLVEVTTRWEGKTVRGWLRADQLTRAPAPSASQPKPDHEPPPPPSPVAQKKGPGPFTGFWHGLLFPFRLAFRVFVDFDLFPANAPTRYWLTWAIGLLLALTPLWALLFHRSCPRCHGAGWVTVYSGYTGNLLDPMGGGRPQGYSERAKCRLCGGTGQRPGRDEMERRAWGPLYSDGSSARRPPPLPNESKAASGRRTPK